MLAAERVRTRPPPPLPYPMPPPHLLEARRRFDHLPVDPYNRRAELDEVAAADAPPRPSLYLHDGAHHLRVVKEAVPRVLKVGVEPLEGRAQHLLARLANVVAVSGVVGARLALYD